MDHHDQLKQMLRQLPAQPFRVLTKDGRTYDVRYRLMNLLNRSYIKIGIPDLSGPYPTCNHTEFVSLKQIDRIELLPKTAVTSVS